MRQNFQTLHSRLLDQWPAPSDTIRTAQNIVKISDAYARQSALMGSLWQNEELSSAYLSYFSPLNLLRLGKVISDAQQLGFLDGLTQLLDFGSGPGTTDLAFFEQNISFQHRYFIESGVAAQEMHKKLLKHFQFARDNAEWAQDFKHSPTISPRQTLAVFSYSLNELTALPTWAEDFPALMIVEPSTIEHGRRLQELRARLITKGFYIWAPCTHQGDCPLLIHSKKDWCHTRIHVHLPDWMQQLEAHLPMKNSSLTFSYLLARKNPPPPAEGKVRIIGDTLHERGKIRQAICRNSEREFFSWLTRHGEPDPLERGRLLDWPAQAVKKGDEWRLTD